MIAGISSTSPVKKNSDLLRASNSWKVVIYIKRETIVMLIVLYISSADNLLDKCGDESAYSSAYSSSYSYSDESAILVVHAGALDK
jgi:hypothetical protein